MITRIIIIGILFLAMIITGLLLSKGGRPLNTILFTIHKLTAVVAIILIVILVYKLNKSSSIGTGKSTAFVLTGILLAMTFISGALLSFDKLVHPVILAIHKIFPYLAILSTAITIYLLYKIKTVTLIII